ncbi:MAG: tetratricopeptide repeat protein [candidate division KSB1 bacterium]|nr:tetratricopeptide repeat protein [candidate division KSB1 bacterium]MDZ7303614.1 tetratricopeptide repeat protein [candidate division KSB1 bacterium]MDZ7312851.1 tetratricopeptide repeat protein [candidate division KSB1 bacterium]
MTPNLFKERSGSGMMTPCPPAVLIGKFLNNELFAAQRHEVESHLAMCQNCRLQLVEIFRASIEPVSEEEKKLLTALPPFDITEQARQIISLMPPAMETPGPMERLSTWLSARLPRLTLPRPAWQIALAVLLIAICLSGYRPFREWQGNRHAQIAISRLQEAWTITNDDLRPAEEFSLSLFSQTHSAESAGAATVLVEFRKALQWDPENRPARLGLATYWCFTGDLASADSLTQLLIEKNPEDYEAWNNHGLIAARREDSTAALSAFDKAVQIRPDYAIATFNRATMLYHLARREEARKAYEDFLKNDPNSKWAEVARTRLQALNSVQKN